MVEENKHQKMQKLFLTLIRIGIGTAEASDEECEALLTLSLNQWKEIMALAERQGVAVLVFDGVQRLYDHYQRDIKAASDFPIEWMRWVFECTGLMSQHEQMNLQQKKVICEIADTLEHKDIKMMVFKGQANASLYPLPMHRAVGDIDCYMFGEADKGDQLLAAKGAVVANDWYRHSKISFCGETIENHRVMCHTRGSKTKKRMEKELIALLQPSAMSHIDACGTALMPPAQFNAFFLTYHALHHFTSEGLRMKQVLDWAMFLNSHQEDVDWDAYNDFCNRYKLDKFAAEMNYIAVHFLGIAVRTDCLLMDGTYAEKLLQNTLYDDDYLFNSGKNDWTVRWMIVKNMFGRDRWKYRDIAQQNVLAHLWQSATGFLFEKD